MKFHYDTCEKRDTSGSSSKAANRTEGCARLGRQKGKRGRGRKGESALGKKKVGMIKGAPEKQEVSQRC